MIRFTASEDRIVRSAEALSEKLSDKFSDKEQRVLELLMEDPGFTSVQIAVGGKMILPPHGKEFFTHSGKKYFT